MTILEEAEQAVSGRRGQDYGSPLVNHKRTAVLWNAYLEGRFKSLIWLNAKDVCFLNILQKISRGMNAITRDTLVDIAGYARNVELIIEEEEITRRRGEEAFRAKLIHSVHEGRCCNSEEMFPLQPKEADSGIQDEKERSLP